MVSAINLTFVLTIKGSKKTKLTPPHKNKKLASFSVACRKDHKSAIFYSTLQNGSNNNSNTSLF